MKNSVTMTNMTNMLPNTLKAEENLSADISEGKERGNNIPNYIVIIIRGKN